MKATVNWQADLVFTGQADSGHSLQMDADEIVGGSNRGIRPMEMLALGLAGCAGMDVISILQKKRQVVTQFEVQVDARRSKEHPKVFTALSLTYRITGREVEEAAVLRAIELTATKYCPAEFMFAQIAPIDIQYEIYDAGDDGARRLLIQGVWQETPSE